MVPRSSAALHQVCEIFRRQLVQVVVVVVGEGVVKVVVVVMLVRAHINAVMSPIVLVCFDEGCGGVAHHTKFVCVVVGMQWQTN